MLYSIFSAILLASLAVLLTPLRKAGLPKNQCRRFALAVSVIFITGAFGLYFLWGSPGIIPLLHQRREALAQLQRAIARHDAEVKSNPADLKAWLALGQEFMEANQYPAAAHAFRESVVLSHGEPRIILAYAEALIFAADGKVTDDAQKALQMVLLQKPQDPEACYWLIVRRLQDGKTQEAMKEMKALYQSLPADSPVKKMIDEEIGRR